ncbi:hypothetical protein SAMN05216312_12014 [Cohnella sp. OV330]|uniref:hypothetical protein n=1 Tax=Cohnella sp. OV330 TaxID=1855288 RepID=UPI0008E036DA|nr:hypothetical protein [Cohnella sp. OV330]SFB62055.1 hypothetical protein SAMN05216312_12014 [Cohnella sp. OV330]
MSINRRLFTDADFQEAMERQLRMRVFKNDHIVDSGGVILRFDDNTVVIQTSVSELAYHNRRDCEFFELKRKT